MATLSDETRIEIFVGRDNIDDGIRLGVDGEPYARVHITPQGQIKTGDGSTAPLPGATGLVAEDVRDIVGAALVQGSHIGINVNDGADTITLSVTGLAAVATSGAYADLSGAPTLAAVAVSGAYADLSGKPTLAAVATSGAYADLSGKPSLATVATSGAYGDLSGLPTLGSAAAQATTAFDAAGAASAAQAAAVQRANHTGTQVMATISDAGTLATKSSVVNADVGAGAAIALSKLATDPLARANHTGTQAMATISDAGSLATKSSIANADVAGGAAIDLAKLATNPLARANHTGTQLLATISDAGTIASQSAAAVNITGGTLTGINPITAAADAVGAPAYSWAGDTDTGLYHVSADTIAFATGGANKLQIGANVTLLDTINLTTSTVTGSIIAAATNQKLGFYGATPITRRAGAAQGTVASTAATNVTPYGYTTAAQADGIVSLVNELRNWAVSQGFIKGSA